MSAVDYQLKIVSLKFESLKLKYLKVEAGMRYRVKSGIITERPDMDLQDGFLRLRLLLSKMLLQEHMRRNVPK